MKATLLQALHDLLGNRMLWTPLAVWAAVQSWKMLEPLIFERRLDFTRLWATGGMPSAHSALVTSLAMGVGMNAGFGSAPFAVAVALAIIVMYDAAGIRRAAGKQAEKINLIVRELFAGHPLNEKELRELLGHTPLQVAIGALIGVLAGWALNL